jgi:hypothetical protein
MTLSVDIYQMKDVRGITFSVGAQARIEFSPSEGFDADKLAALERDLSQFVEDRLNGALTIGKDGRSDQP